MFDRTPDPRPPREVTFIVPGEAEPIVVKMVDHNADTICAAARTLKARYFVTTDGWFQGSGMHQWGVFDMRRADPNGGGPRQWAIPDPLRVFPNRDGAVMFALHRRGLMHILLARDGRVEHMPIRANRSLKERSYRGMTTPEWVEAAGRAVTGKGINHFALRHRGRWFLVRALGLIVMRELPDDAEDAVEMWLLHHG